MQSKETAQVPQRVTRSTGSAGASRIPVPPGRRGKSSRPPSSRGGSHARPASHPGDDLGEVPADIGIDLGNLLREEFTTLLQEKTDTLEGDIAHTRDRMAAMAIPIDERFASIDQRLRQLAENHLTIDDLRQEVVNVRKDINRVSEDFAVERARTNDRFDRMSRRLGILETASAGPIQDNTPLEVASGPSVSVPVATLDPEGDDEESEESGLDRQQISDSNRCKKKKKESKSRSSKRN